MILSSEFPVVVLVNTLERKTPEKEPRVTMYYDGGCPLCRREVEHYKRVDIRGQVSWIDIDEDDSALASIGVSRKAAMKRLHVTDKSGNIVTGAFAFNTLWRELPRYRWLAFMTSPQWLLWLADKAYDRFAKRRYAHRNKACATSCASDDSSPL